MYSSSYSCCLLDCHFPGCDPYLWQPISKADTTYTWGHFVPSNGTPMQSPCQQLTYNPEENLAQVFPWSWSLKNLWGKLQLVRFIFSWTVCSTVFLTLVYWQPWQKYLWETDVFALLERLTNLAMETKKNYAGLLSSLLVFREHCWETRGAMRRALRVHAAPSKIVENVKAFSH